MIDFFIALEKIPTVTHQQKSVRVVNGKPIFYEPARLKDTRQLFLGKLYQHRIKEPLTGALKLHTVWFFPNVPPHKTGEWKTSKPDTDNLIKLFKDCMTDIGFWKDDAQVAQEITEKVYGNSTEGIVGINVTIQPLGTGIIVNG